MFVDGDKGELELLFIDPKYHNQGIGQATWKEIERIYPNVKVWETFTPGYEKRNIHFYINKLGFQIVKYFNEKHIDPNHPSASDFFKFRKIIK